MEFSKIYVYALIDNDIIIYVGKSTLPKVRLTSHKATYNNIHLKLKILDFFYDKEQYWVSKLIKEGHPLQNKEFQYENESWEIGDIIESKSNNNYQIKDIETGEIFESLYTLSKNLKIDWAALKTRLNNSKKYPEFSKYQLIK